MREATPIKRTDLWTEEEDEALRRGRLKHGNDWKKVHKTENEVFGHRKLNNLKSWNQRIKK